MKQIMLALMFSALVPSVARAETRTIAIEVFRGTDNSTKVTLHSVVEEEKKADATVADAVAILKEATGWGSSVLVVIVTDGTNLRNYIPLLNAIAENPWLDLVGVRERTRLDMATMILQHYKIEKPPERDK